MSEAAAPRPNHLAAVPGTADERESTLRELVAAIAHHKDQAERHSEAAKAAESALMKLHGQRGSTIDVGANKVTWKTPGRSFDKAAFVKAYPPETNDYLYTTPEPVPTLDMTAIPPKLKDRFMQPGSGEGSIIIK